MLRDASALWQRYRDPQQPELGAVSETIALQLRHRSVRRFLPEAVAEEELSAIVAAAQSASTSSNQQSWSVVAVREPARKARVAELCGDQGFIDQAPLFLVWVADLARVARLAERRGAPLDGADYLESTLVGVIDVALAAQNAVVAAESLGLGAVYVGAARNHPEELAAELRLPERAFPVFGLALGWPDPADTAGIKTRLPQSGVLHHEVYDAAAADAAVQAYEPRLAAYYAEQGREHSWAERALSRWRGPEGLSGRHRLREALERLGWPSR